MKRLLFGLLISGFVVVVGVRMGVLNLSALSSLPKKLTEKKAHESQVSGDVQGKVDVPIVIRSTTESIQTAVEPVVLGISNVAQDAIETTAQKSASDGAKIDVQSVTDQVKKQIDEIPQEVFEKVRYEYCKQVIVTYEQDHQ